MGVTLVAGSLLVWQAHAVAGLTMGAASGALALISVYRWVFEPAVATEVAEGAAAHH